MRARPRLLLPLCVAALARSASPGVEQDAAAIAARYLEVMEWKDYSFLSKEELQRRRDRVAAFVTEHLRQPLDGPSRAAVLVGVDRCLDRLYATPKGTVDYGNGFGSGGEEWVYLNDRDYFRTFQYCLWVALARPATTAADALRRDAQRAWMREDLTYGSYRSKHPQRDEKLRREVLEEFELSLADPVDLLSHPMPDDAFGELKQRILRYSNGIDGDIQQMRVAALTWRFPSKEDAAGRAYAGRLPFDDTVVGLWANAPHLCFASNALFRGSQGTIESSLVYDVMRCREMRTKPFPAPGPAMDAWLAIEGRGELTLDGKTLVAVRGARIAALPVTNWFEADALPDERLRALVREGARDRVAVGQLPPMNGPRPRRYLRNRGECFIIVQTPEDRLAVVNLHNLEFGLSLWCRPRAAGP